MTIENNCDVCQGESGGEYVGVASIPGAPMSIAWCNKCLAIDAVPWFILKHDFIYVAAGHLENLAEWALARCTWVDGHYVPFTEYVKRFTPEEVERELKAYEEAMTREPGDTA
jgi:hypothetical protein